MKRILVGCVLAAWIWAVPTQAQEPRSKVVTVNMDRVFNEYYKTKQADAQLKTQAKEFEEERQKLLGEMEQIDREFNSLREDSQNTALSEEVRAAKRTLAEEKLMAKREQESKIRRFMELRQKQLDDQGRRMRRSIVDELRGVVKEYARERGIEIVLDASGNSLNGVELVLFADSRIDVTGDIIQAANRAAGEAAAPATGE
ncbi:MAG: OmpH family outer membrane protein [Kiritimatiellae bacterium]|nr:OmpH family outer membrane protein [Kiritimatiellia bacterium]